MRFSCICPINGRSGRTESSIWIRLARITRSGAIERRPSAAQSTSNPASRPASASVTACHILRSGCRAGTRPSGSAWLKSEPIIPSPSPAKPPGKEVVFQVRRAAWGFAAACQACSGFPARQDSQVCLGMGERVFLAGFRAVSPAHPALPCGLRLWALGRATLCRNVTFSVRAGNSKVISQGPQGGRPPANPLAAPLSPLIALTSPCCPPWDTQVPTAAVPPAATPGEAASRHRGE